jgi:hypothetical protein
MALKCRINLKGCKALFYYNKYMNANWVGPQILKELTQMIDIDPSNLVHIENKK